MQAAEFGGKAAGLWRLRQLGHAVPEFTAVPTRALDEVVARDGRIARALGDVARLGLDAVPAASAEIADLVRRSGCPARVAERARLELHADGPLAVRSSVVGEDGPDHSFAGLMDSRLRVTGDALPEAIADVWASAFSARALAYRHRRGLPLDGIRAGVVVQRMVDARAAGVAFSHDPSSGSGTCLIAAVHGTAERLVQGTEDGESWRLDPDGALHAPAGRAVLQGADAQRIGELVRRLEQQLGGPQDVEWALDEEDRLWLLQARPLAAPGPRAHRVWDDANVVESYPGLTLPLSFSFGRRGYESAFRAATRSFLPFRDLPAERPWLFASLIGLHRGRVSYNLLDWYELFSFFSDPAAHRRSWDRLIGVGTATASPLSTPGLGLRAWAALRGVAAIVAMPRRARVFRRRFAELVQRWRAAPAPRGAADLAARYRALEADSARFWYLTLLNDLCAIRGHAALHALLARWAPELGPDASALLAGSPGLESLEPVRALDVLVQRLSADEDAWAAVLAEAWDDPRLRPYRPELEAYVERFGDRGIGELKMETVTLREEPSRILRRLREHVPPRSAAPDRAQLEARIAARLSPARRFVLAAVLRYTRAALRHRESMRLDRARLYGLVRGLFRGMGTELAAAGRIRCADDVFLLGVEEVLAAAEHTGITADLAALVELRRREYAEFAQQPAPSRFETLDFADAPAPIQASLSGGDVLRGIACAPGVVQGRARVVDDPAAATLEAGDVLVAPSTDPGWVFLLTRAGALVSERGSLLSHTAIVGRELGVPTVVGVAGATTRIRSGDTLVVDGGRGEIRWA